MMKDKFAHAAAGGAAHPRHHQVGNPHWSVAARGAQAMDSLAALGREFATAAKRWHVYRRTIAEFGRMDHQQLENLGVHPSEIAVVAYQIAERQANARPRVLSTSRSGSKFRTNNATGTGWSTSRRPQSSARPAAE